MNSNDPIDFYKKFDLFWLEQNSHANELSYQYELQKPDFPELELGSRPQAIVELQVDKLAELLMTSESSTIRPKSLLDFWQLMAESLPDFFPGISNSISSQLKEVFSKLNKQITAEQLESKEWIFKEILHLNPGQSFHLLLTQNLAFNKDFTLEHIVVYKKNANKTFDICLYAAQPNSWQEQEGEFALGHEATYPVLYFANVPETELFGPNLEDKVHIQSLEKASKYKAGKNAYLAVFKPLNSYLIKPPSPLARQVHVTHAHALKGINAYLYDSLCLILHKEDKSLAIRLYKAVIALSHVMLSSALYLAIQGSEENKRDDLIGLLKEIVTTAGRTLIKQKNNPYLSQIFESAVAKISEIKIQSETLMRRRFRSHYLEDDSTSVYLPQGYQKRLGEFETNLKTFVVADDLAAAHQTEPPSFSFPALKVSKKPALFNEWFNELSKVKEEFLDGFIEQLPFPTPNSVWFKLDKPQIVNAISILRYRVVNRLVSYNFNSKNRFSLETHNNAAKLLIIAYTLTALLDEKKILSRFTPALKQYKKLIKSPYFQVESLQVWQKREEIVGWIKKQKLSGKKEAFVFDEASDFSKNGDYKFSLALLEISPKLVNPLKESVKNRYPKLEMAHYLGLFDEEESVSSPLNNLADIALHVHLLSDPKAYKESSLQPFNVHFKNGWQVSLQFIKKGYATADFFSEGQKPNALINFKKEKNLLPKATQVDSQNQTLSRLAGQNEEENHYYIFEQAASNPKFTPINLLSELIANPGLLKDLSILPRLERYLFKVLISENGKEQIPLIEELTKHPLVFSELFRQFLRIAEFKAINNNLFFFTLRLLSLANALPCPQLKSTIESFLKPYIQEWRRQVTASVSLDNLETVAFPRLFLLKIFELKALDLEQRDYWKEYFKLCEPLSLQLESGNVKLESKEFLLLSKLRFKMSANFQHLVINNPRLANDILNYCSDNPFSTTWDFSKYPKCYKKSDLPFDFTSMTYGSGALKGLSPLLMEHPEFKKLFNDRIRQAKLSSIEGNPVWYFKDPLTQFEYFLKNEDSFPKDVYRKPAKERSYSKYIPYRELLKLNLPSSVMQEGSWWVGKDVSCYHFKDPAKVWIKSDDRGNLIFQDGLEEGMRLDLNSDNRPIILERTLSSYGSHHFAYKGRFANITEKNLRRDILSFPNLHMPYGKPLIFERKDNQFVEKESPHRTLKGIFTEFKFFSYYASKGSSLFANGIVLERDFSTEILLPFCPHWSEPHSNAVHPHALLSGPAAPSYYNSLETLAIPLDSYRFLPKGALQTLFVAYLSLIAKDYQSASKFLKNVRPHHRLDEKERMVLKWMIDSTQDANDHSSMGAALRLRAYLLLFEKGMPISKVLHPHERPKTSLEETYLNYLKHLSSVPKLLRLKSWQEIKLIEEALQVFPPEESNLPLFEMRLKDLKDETFHVFSSKLPVASQGVPLLERWSHPVRPKEFEVSAELFLSLRFRQNEEILPGKEYPLTKFGFHYMSLRQAPKNWALIYKLETVQMPFFIKMALMAGFQLGEKAPKFPKLKSEKNFGNKFLAKEWFSELFDLLDEETPVKNSTEIKKIEFEKSSNQEVEEGQKDKEFTAKIDKIIKDKTLNPADFKLEFLKLLTPPLTKVVSRNFTTPFLIKSADESFNQELKAYDLEWKKALSFQGTTELDRISLETYARLLNFDWTRQLFIEIIKLLELDLVRLLNRAPLEPPSQATAILEEASEFKSSMHMDDVLKMAFLPDAQRKLKFLKKRNPYLNAEHLRIIEKLLVHILEMKAFQDLFFLVLDKFKPILKVIKEENLATRFDDWYQQPVAIKLLDTPQVNEAEEEIRELLSCEMDTRLITDPQKKMERLLFEHFSGLRIRKDQADVLHHVIEQMFEAGDKKSFSIVFQLIMGGGKTSVILANLAKHAASKDKVPLFAAHYSQYASLKANIMDAQSLRLDQNVVDLNFTRKDLADLKVLTFIRKQFELAKEKKRMILAPSSFLQIMQLEFRENLKAFMDPQNRDPSAEARFRELATVLDFIMRHCLLMADEVDLTLSILEEVNFPSGGSVPISKMSLDVIKEVYSILSTDSRIIPLLKIQEDDQAFLVSERLKNSVFPILIDSLIANLPALSLLVPHKNHQKGKLSLRDYLLGKIDGRLQKNLPENDDEKILSDLGIKGRVEHKAALRHRSFLRHVEGLKTSQKLESKSALDAAALIKELCTEILPISLSKSYERNYGFLPNHKVIPYLGVGAPSPTEFGNIYVTACYYFQAALAKGVTQEMLLDYRDKLMDAASYYAELHHCPIQETLEAKHFEILTGCPLHLLKDEEQIQKTLDLLNSEPQRCLDLYAEFSHVLRYHPSLSRCGSIALSKMGSQFVGCAGSLWNKETFPIDIANTSMPQEGSEGRIIAKLHSDLKSGKGLFHLIDQPTPKGILQSLISKRGGESVSRVRSLIDVCGMLKRYTNVQVAQEILDMDEFKEEVEALVTILKTNQGEAFYLIRRGEIPIALKSTSKESIEECGLSLDKVFVYYDELRTTGSDIPLKADAVCALTFDPNQTTIRDLLQGALRPRGFFRRQLVDIAIEKNAMEGFMHYDEKDSKASLTSENLFSTAVRNQSNDKRPQMLRSGVEQIRENYRSHVYQHLVYLVNSNRDEDLLICLKLTKASEWLFSSTFRDDPSALFLGLEVEKDAFVSVEEAYLRTAKQFKETCASYFDPAEIKMLDKQALDIVDWAKQTLTWKVLSAHTKQSLELQVIVEAEAELQKEVQVDVQKETQKELQKYAVRIDAPPAEVILWEKINPSPTSVFDYKTPPLLSFSEFLKRCPYDAPYDQIFPKDLTLTENFSRSHEIDLPVFHRAQKNVQQLLLIKASEGFRVLFIDATEAQFWRDEIYAHKLPDCWLVDIMGNSLNDNHAIPLEAKDVLDRNLWWGHFFNGNASYLRSKRPLVESELRDEAYELKCRYLRLRAANDPTQTKVLAIDPVFTSAQNLAPVFAFPNREEEEAWQAKEIVHLSKLELNQLPFHFSRYIPGNRIPDLTRKGYFAYLSSELFTFVTLKQIPFLSDYQLQYLTKKEQIKAIPQEKVVWLKGEALQFLPDEFLEKINPNELINLTAKQKSQYQDLMIERYGLESFAKSATKRMAPAILPKCVVFLDPSCFAYLATNEQLKEVSVTNYSLLKAGQFHLLPEENWKELNQEDFKKYGLEEKILKDAKKCIQSIPSLWVDELDARLAAYYTEEQVKKITKPIPVQYLSAEQLKFLNPTLWEYLTPAQVALLNKEHKSLIEAIQSPEIFKFLSPQGLCLLNPIQIALVNSRDILIKLDSSSYDLLNKDQIKLLDLTNEFDQKIVHHLTHDQIKNLALKKQVALLPYLSARVIKFMEPTVFASAKTLSSKVIKELNHIQVQTYLSSEDENKDKIKGFLKKLSAEQWRGMDAVFIQSFFEDVPKEVVKCIPDRRVKDLAKSALFLRLDREENKIKDRILGALSLIFYPFTFATSVFAGIFVGMGTFKKIAFSPLRLLVPEIYYREILAAELTS